MSSTPEVASDVGSPAADTPGPLDSELRPLDPRVRMLWWISAGAALTLPITAALVLHFAVGGIIAMMAWVAVAALAALAAVVPPIRYARWRYAVRAEDLWIRRGVLWVTVSVVPFSRLQFVDTHQGPLDRVFGLASLVVHTAALGASISLPGLALAEAEGLRERLADVDPDVISV